MPYHGLSAWVDDLTESCLFRGGSFPLAESETLASTRFHSGVAACLQGERRIFLWTAEYCSGSCVSTENA